MTLQLLDKSPPKEVPDQFYQARKKLGDEAPKLPQGAIGPFVNDEYSDVSFALYSVEAPGFPLRKLTRVAEEFRQRFLHVPGVKKVDIVGEQQERIFVEFSYPRLTMLGISPADIFSALSRQNAVTPAGSVNTDGPQVFVRLDGAYTDLDRIRNTPIVVGTQSFKLSDIADVTRGYEDPATFVIRHNGESALLLSVVMKEGWNGLDLGEALRAEIDKISSSLPLGASLKKVTDQAVNIRSAVNEFMVKFAMAVGVVMLVSLLSLGWRVGIVVVAAIPLTLGAVFVIMMVTDRVFDRITLGALIISLGLLVDDAIIAIETMVVKMEEGVDRIQAAAYAWSHRSANARRDDGNRNRVFAGGLCPFDCGRICRKYFLDCRLLLDRLVDRRRGFHAVSGGKTSSRDQNREGRPRGNLCDSWIPAPSPFHNMVREEKIYGGWDCCGSISSGGRRDGCREETVFPKL